MPVAECFADRSRLYLKIEYNYDFLAEIEYSIHMRVSEAMSLGAMMAPQSFGGDETVATIATWMGYPVIDERRTCAFQAALDACPPVSMRMMEPGETANGSTLRGGRSQREVIISSEWMQIISHEGLCPACSMDAMVGVVIAHLNDDHRWSRQAIAEWLAPVEVEILAGCEVWRGR